MTNTTITAERARALLDEITYSHGWGPKSMTADERRAIVRAWGLMSGHTAFYDAVKAIAEGRIIFDACGTPFARGL